jgi:beta-lactamase regulating signal transducer with metallopeptidase domain
VVVMAPLGCLLGLLWLTGAAGYLALNLLRATRGHFWLRRARQPLPGTLQAEYANLLLTYGARHLPRIWVQEGVGQPFVWGLLRGDIYVPTAFLTIENTEHRRDVLAHELSHVMRWDAAVNALQVIDQGLFWLHPFVWWANRQIRREREKCCDEMVLARLHTTPKDYSTAIVETLTRARESVRPVPSLAVAGPLKSIDGRIRAMLRPGRRFYARPSAPTAVLVGLVALTIVPTVLVLTAKAWTPIALPAPLAEFPRTLNGWTGEDLPLPAAIQEYLRAGLADDFLCRRYVDKTVLQWADLYVVYCSSRPERILATNPFVCFPANGWTRDQTLTSQITTPSGRRVECLGHRFHRLSREEVVVLCFYLTNGPPCADTPDFAALGARSPNLSGNRPRYVAQVQISSALESSIRAAASVMIDPILNSLPDFSGRTPGRQSIEASLPPAADPPVSSDHDPGS